MWIRRRRRRCQVVRKAENEKQIYTHVHTRHSRHIMHTTPQALTAVDEELLPHRLPRRPAQGVRREEPLPDVRGKHPGNVHKFVSQSVDRCRKTIPHLIIITALSHTYTRTHIPPERTGRIGSHSSPRRSRSGGRSARAIGCPRRGADSSPGAARPRGSRRRRGRGPPGRAVARRGAGRRGSRAPGSACRCPRRPPWRRVGRWRQPQKGWFGERGGGMEVRKVVGTHTLTRTRERDDETRRTHLVISSGMGSFVW